MTNLLSVTETAGLLRSADDILIVTHKSPDGDTVGSGSALCALLRKLGKTAYVMKNATLTARLLPYAAPYFPPEDFSPAFICAVDIADPRLLNEDAKVYADAFDLCIDHHPTNTGYAKNTCLDPAAAACGEIIAELAAAPDIGLDSEIALHAYLAVCTDTGCFKYPSVTAKTHRIAARLIETGINFYHINNTFTEIKSVARMSIERTLAENMAFRLDGRVALTHITEEAVNTAAAGEDDLENLSGITRQIEGVQVGILLREKDGGWKISVRTSPEVDASEICGKFGGGGHAGAAGGSFTGSLEEAKAALFAACEEVCGANAQ
ncbi:MAG: DHH family phosphoesterase [Oscillospiraceae bacterium]|jgi:phosphoesterase RecJ-like protein|nr:DHH family phosphoesterase [Oscillospiraceae bacterium]